MKSLSASVVAAISIAFGSVAVMVACGGDDANVSSSNGGSGNPSGVGNSCTKNEDCSTNNRYLGPGGGYCATTCSDEGSTSQCPLDTICKPIQGGARRQRRRLLQPGGFLHALAFP